MSSTSQAEGRDAQLLHIGKQCSHSSCLLVDFLPFTCQHCNLAFCQEHFMVSAHQCPMYDETKYNRVAPDCPFCKVPVAFRPGQDPNIRMEQHFRDECITLLGKSNKPKSSPVCARGNCKKVLFAPITCDKCRKQFCPAHRFPADHTCLPPMAASSAWTAKIPTSNPSSIDMRNLNAKASAAGVATIGAIKKTLTPSLGSPATNSHKAPSKPVIVPPTIFSKTSRRAKAEQESRRKAMEGRAKKGLLSEEEKAILEAEQAQKSEKKGDCVLM